MTCRKPLIASLFVLSSVAVLGQDPIPWQLPDTRTVVMVLDVTPSFHDSDASIRKIKDVVRALGPGDSFLLITLGGNFSPRQDVAIQCVMPKMDRSVVEPAHNIREWKERQARIDAVWAASSQRQAAVLKELDRPYHQRDGTPLYQLLHYVSDWFASTPVTGPRLLFVLSDLEHDYGGVQSSLPPRTKLPFDALSVTAAFVPWHNGWPAREAAWRNWFSPADFTMLDETKARAAVLVSPNQSPRQAMKAF